MPPPPPGTPRGTPRDIVATLPCHPPGTPGDTPRDSRSPPHTLTSTWGPHRDTPSHGHGDPTGTARDTRDPTGRGDFSATPTDTATLRGPTGTPWDTGASQGTPTDTRNPRGPLGIEGTPRTRELHRRGDSTVTHRDTADPVGRGDPTDTSQGDPQAHQGTPLRDTRGTPRRVTKPHGAPSPPLLPLPPRGWTWGLGVRVGGSGWGCPPPTHRVLAPGASRVGAHTRLAGRLRLAGPCDTRPGGAGGSKGLGGGAGRGRDPRGGP